MKIRFISKEVVRRGLPDGAILSCSNEIGEKIGFIRNIIAKFRTKSVMHFLQVTRNEYKTS